MPLTQNLPVLVYIKLFLGNLKKLNHRILMMEYCSTGKAKKRKEKKEKKRNLSILLKILYANILSSIVMSKSNNVAFSP